MTKEFGSTVIDYLEKVGWSKTRAADSIEVHESQIVRITRGERGLDPGKATALMCQLKIPASEQAMFLLKAGELPEELAVIWLDELEKTTTPIGIPTVSETFKKYLPGRKEVYALARSMRKDPTSIYKHWRGDIRKRIFIDIRLELCERLPLPIEERVQFFLAAAGFDREIIRTVLENYRNPTEESPAAAEAEGDQGDQGETTPISQINIPDRFTKRSPVRWNDW